MMLAPDYSGPGNFGLDPRMTAKILAPLTQDQPLEDSINNYGRAILMGALDRHRKIKNLCEGLEIPRSTLRDKQIKWDIQVGDE